MEYTIVVTIKRNIHPSNYVSDDIFIEMDKNMVTEIIKEQFPTSIVSSEIIPTGVN